MQRIVFARELETVDIVRAQRSHAVGARQRAGRIAPPRQE
jgi:hypothetical protein